MAAASPTISQRSRHRFAGPRRCRFRPIIRSRSRNARSARRCSTTSACPSTAAWHARAATSAAKALPTARSRVAACPAVPSSAIPRPCGISPGPRRCSGTGAPAASRSRWRDRSSRPMRWRNRLLRSWRGLPPIPPPRARSPKPFPRRRGSMPPISPARSRPTSAPSCRRSHASTAGLQATSGR